MQSEAHTLPHVTSLNFIHNFFKHLKEKEMPSLTGVQPGDRGGEDLKLSVEEVN